MALFPYTCGTAQWYSGVIMAKKALRFQIEVLHDREVTEIVRRRNPTRGKETIINEDGEEVENLDHRKNFIEEEQTRVIPTSYMVYFPNGHSTWFETKAAMAQAGIVESENFEVDLETGLPVMPHAVMSLKEHVERNTRTTQNFGRRA